MTKMKIIKIIVITAVVLLLILSALLMWLFIPLKGAQNDTEYWSEYDKFDSAQVQTVKKKNKDFKILQLTDLHYHLPHKTKETDNIVKKLVADNTPDMIVLTGDNIFGVWNYIYAKHLIKLMDSFEIPWALVNGNHDNEGKADKYWLGEQYEASKYCLYKNGAFNIGGVGNYAVNIMEENATQPFYSVIMMDSNNYTEYNGTEQYGSFTASQVSWYEWMINGLNIGQETLIPSMMFFHIPFPEYLTAYNEWEAGDFNPNVGVGEKFEGVCCGPYNPGMFAKIKEMQSTKNVFVGHDHVNNFSVDYQGVRLTYGMKSSRQFYSKDAMVGGTLITISDDKKVDIQNKFYKF